LVIGVGYGPAVAVFFFDRLVVVVVVVVIIIIIIVVVVVVIVIVIVLFVLACWRLVLRLALQRRSFLIGFFRGRDGGGCPFRCRCCRPPWFFFGDGRLLLLLLVVLFLLELLLSTYVLPWSTKYKSKKSISIVRLVRLSQGRKWRPCSFRLSYLRLANHPISKYAHVPPPGIVTSVEHSSRNL
jgi:hypothetical protein